MKKVLSILCSLFILISSVFSVNVFAKEPKPIAMCLDDNYTLPTIVAMTSMLENVKEDTEYKYYLLVPGDFQEENKKKILSLKEKYKSKAFDIDFIDMGDEFKDAKTTKFWTTPTFYRLDLPSLLSTYNKCIYLDGDAVVEKDLSELYNIDLEDNYVGGVRDCGLGDDYAKILGISDMDKYINAGVLLMNLKKLRDDKLEDKFKWFVENKVNKCNEILLQDQDTVNACCFDKIKILPPKYNCMQHFINKNYCVSFYGKDQNDEAFNDPVVIHYAASFLKPWKNTNVLFAEKWWDYAIKSGIYDKLPVAMEIKKKILEMQNNPKSNTNKTLDDGIYTISSKLNPNMCLDINRGSKNDKANLQLWQKNGTNAQKFKVLYNSDGYYTIEAMCSGKFIDVSESGKKNGTNIWQCSKNGTDAQKWLIVPYGEGYYCLIPKCNDLCMDVCGAKAKNGANIHCWSVHGGDNQRFKFEKCEDKPMLNKPNRARKPAGKPRPNKPLKTKKNTGKPASSKSGNTKKSA